MNKCYETFTYFLKTSNLPACINVYHITCLVPTGLLELELPMTVSHHVGDGTQTLVFCKISKCSQPQSHLSRPPLLVLCRALKGGGMETLLLDRNWTGKRSFFSFSISSRLGIQPIGKMTD